MKMKIAMNWQRGLLRLWVVSAIAWAALVVVIGPSGVSRYWPTPLFFAVPPDLPPLAPPHCIPSDTKMDPVEALNSLKPRCPSPSKRAEPDYFSRPLRFPTWYDAWVKFFIAIAGLPLATLLLGGGLRWALKGFAR